MRVSTLGSVNESRFSKPPSVQFGPIRICSKIRGDNRMLIIGVNDKVINEKNFETEKLFHIELRYCWVTV
jgi:hypothetical protein